MSTVNISDNMAQEEKQEDFRLRDNIGQLEEMYRAGVHFGYSRSSLNPGMKPYIFALRNNVEIFDLEKVAEALGKAVQFLKELGIKRAPFLLVATKPEASDFVEKASKELGMPYVTGRWLGGTLTNFTAFRKNITKFERLFQDKNDGKFAKFPKKEIARIDRELGRMEKRFGGLRQLKELPQALIILDPKIEKAAVKEAQMTKIPIVAVLNSDCNPKPINYPVPGNDASLSSIQYFFEKLLDGYKDGLKIMPVETPAPKSVEKKETKK